MYEILVTDVSIVSLDYSEGLKKMKGFTGLEFVLFVTENRIKYGTEKELY